MRHADLKLAAAARARATRSSCSARGPARTASAGRRCWPAPRSAATAAQAKRPSVQVGDPFTEKLLVECCLELYAAGLVSGIQDLGAAGVSCATAELAAGGGSGMRVDLDAVPLRDPALGPAEILMSESQERMMAVVEPGNVGRFLEICARWDVLATVIGEVTDTGRLDDDWHGEQVVDIPPGSAADDGPVYRRPIAAPGRPGRAAGRRPGPAGPAVNRRRAARRRCCRCSARPGRRDKTWVTEQYDRLRPRQHRAGHAGGRRGAADRRADRPRRRAGHRRQRPVLPARPVRRCAARAGRGVPERGRDRRACRWPSPTA